MALAQFFKRTFATPAVRKWFFNKSGYNQYGLYRDDLYYETPEVEEALRRLPQDVRDARIYRIVRAHQLTLTHTLLPKEQWTTFEDDEKNRYLKPYLEEVEKEFRERALWSKIH